MRSVDLVYTYDPKHRDVVRSVPDFGFGLLLLLQTKMNDLKYDMTQETWMVGKALACFIMMRLSQD